MPIPPDYAERVYAGVLGKLIGVYLGRPFEGWSYERIMAELGEIAYYVHDRLDKPLVVTDDDLSGTFTFLRALPDYDHRRALTPAQVGQTWLNYIIEGRTILWWGGMGNSTEHTAYLRLKSGVEAPRSGSMALNGRIVAEQIGAQIFIDGWGMVAPGNPELAADLARRAASVSHDGEAIHGAQVIAALEAQAFVDSDLNRLLDVALALIPADSVIARLINDLRDLHAKEPDWRRARAWLAAHHGYEKYGGNCPIVSNHGLVILSLLYGEDDFQRSLLIVNTSGWDTDCNSGNVGCLLGIKNGLAGLDAGPDWRGPIADRLYLPTADGGRAITDALSEAYHVVNIGRALAGEPPLAPKGGARFHFALPGAVQGFRPEEGSAAIVENVAGPGEGRRCLAIHLRGSEPEEVARLETPTFIPPEAIAMPGYELLASPTLYPGQTVRAVLIADKENALPVTCRLYARVYDVADQLTPLCGPETTLPPGEQDALLWRIPATGGAPIAGVGVEISAPQQSDGTLYLDTLTWDGAPDMTLTLPATGGALWRRAWVGGVDCFDSAWGSPYRLIQNRGTGLVSQGAREWTDYRVSAAITPYLAESAGIGLYVQGMCRYYALLLCRDHRARLVKALDGDTVLAEVEWPWAFGETHALALQMVGTRLQGWINDHLLFDVNDVERPLKGGGVALICEEGCMTSGAITVQPAQPH